MGYFFHSFIVIFFKPLQDTQKKYQVSDSATLSLKKDLSFIKRSSFQKNKKGPEQIKKYYGVIYHY